MRAAAAPTQLDACAFAAELTAWLEGRAARPVAPRRSPQTQAWLDPHTFQTICSDLRSKGVDAAIGDRDLRPGAKFKDLEPLGFPVENVVGRRASEGVVEFGQRRDSARVEMPVGDAQAKALAAIGRC